MRLAGEYAGAGESQARIVAVHGEDDAATREYRYGDDLRRVHWRSTARTGELMVRREEQPWECRATLCSTPAAVRHRGEGPTASFEWAVSAAASIAAAPAPRRVQDPPGHRHRRRRRRQRGDGDGALLDHLAEVQLSPARRPRSAVDRVRRRGPTAAW